MSHSQLLAIDVPCAVCLSPINSWIDGIEDTPCPWGGPQGNAQAIPCGHFLEEMWVSWEQAIRERLEHAGQVVLSEL